MTTAPHLPCWPGARNIWSRAIHQGDRIVYGTGKIVASAELDIAAAEILERDDVAYVHVRSSVNNCYTCRVERA